MKECTCTGGRLDSLRHRWPRAFGHYYPCPWSTNVPERLPYNGPDTVTIKLDFRGMGAVIYVVELREWFAVGVNGDITIDQWVEIDFPEKIHYVHPDGITIVGPDGVNPDGSR